MKVSRFFRLILTDQDAVMNFCSVFGRLSIHLITYSAFKNSTLNFIAPQNAGNAAPLNAGCQWLSIFPCSNMHTNS